MSSNRGGQVDLVDDRDDRQVVLERQVQVVDCLRLHALHGVDDQQRAFAGGQRTADLVAGSRRAPACRSG
jgi:hypothetical protein